MSIKRRVLAVAATMTMVGGVSAVGLLPAAASITPSTPSFDDCLTVFSQEFGTFGSPNFVLDVYKQGETVGTHVILYRASASDPAEDFTISRQGTVNSFEAIGVVTDALALHYGNLPAYEYEYSPYGVDSGLCMGVGSTAGDGTPVALENCGQSSKTLWVRDYYKESRGFVPLINGSDTNFSTPYVLHYPDYGYPTDTPRPQLTTYTLQEYSNGGVVYDNELWAQIDGGK